MAGLWDKRGAPNNYPAEGAFAITPDDSNDLAEYTRGVYVGSTGNLKVTMLNGTTVTFPAVAAGIVHPFRVKRVFANGTSASGLVGVY